eukprot:CAMPEP_0172464254 /NCGR_PEP_ID=MMETSP1065-20121228/49933_1 /TAXON_ID=265537 /ORGANISM="Amphiprora paludosa, Strain CCMP125" /LENGTH=54 /DNA_ID=CAMNT_0013220437 /DNA_START=114 /DNA_END=275 /DNA_ORIENTATION=-
MSGHDNNASGNLPDKTTNKLATTENPVHRLVEYFVIVSSVETHQQSGEEKQEAN